MIFSLLTHVFFILFIFFTLQYCIGFAIHWHESATGVHEIPILNPPPTTLPISSWTVVLEKTRESLGEQGDQTIQS